MLLSTVCMLIALVGTSVYKCFSSLSFILGRCLYPRRDWVSMAVLLANYELAKYWEGICRGLIYIYLDIFIDLQRQTTNLNQDGLRPAQDSRRTQNNTNLDRYCQYFNTMFGRQTASICCDFYMQETFNIDH